MSQGITCYRRDEALCKNPECVRKGCVLQNHPTIRENPRLYLHNRADRLNRLCELKAPTIVLRGEVALILQALAEVVRQEEPNVKLTVEFEALRTKLSYPDDEGKGTGCADSR